MAGLLRAGNGTRTRDPNLGKVVLYQLSYSRLWDAKSTTNPGRPPVLPPYRPTALPPSDGGEGNRTPDLLNAIQALSQLSYAPVILGAPIGYLPEHGKLAERYWGVKRSTDHG